MAEELTYACPTCGSAVALAIDEHARLVACPHCAAEFLLPASDGSTELPEDREACEAAERDAELRHEAELSAARIRALAVARRAAYRQQSYFVVAAVVNAVAVVQLAINTARRVRLEGWGWKPTSYVLFAALAIWGLTYFARRATGMRRETQRRGDQVPAAEPDFSTLSDGSQHWKNLDQMRGGPSGQ